MMHVVVACSCCVLPHAVSYVMRVVLHVVCLVLRAAFCRLWQTDMCVVVVVAAAFSYTLWHWCVVVCYCYY